MSVPFDLLGLATPWALAGAVALPVLLLVYLLRRRGRELPVPALFLWAAVAAPAAGARVARRRLPAVFWLELAALGLLVAGAAGPWLPGPGSRPLLVVLDPSYSMAAGGSRSPWRQAETALLDALRRAPTVRTTLVVAGDPPSALGEDLDAAAVARALRAWRPEAPAANLDAALRLAAERDGGGGRSSAILVLTDGPAPADLSPRIAWWAFGAPLPNLAIVAADRSPGAAGGRDGGDRVTLEVANLGTAAADVPLGVDAGRGEGVVRRRLDAGESWRLRLPVAAGVRVRAHLPGDALPVDDELVLPPLAAPPVRVRVDGLQPRLAAAVRSAVAASGLAELDPPTGATLEVVPVISAPPRAGCWRVLVSREAAATPYLGPFVLDARHPLAAGLVAEGVVWAAGGSSANPPGRPVLAAGGVVLLSDEERADGGHDLHLRLREDLSTLERAPLWPVLWWNLLGWRRAQLPGPEQPVVRLGEVAGVRLPAGVVAARARGAGWSAQLQASEGIVRWLPPRPGDYELEAGGSRFTLAVATLQRAESDLRERRSERRGDPWSGAAGPGRRPFAWAAGLLALALLVGEGALLAGARPRSAGG